MHEDRSFSKPSRLRHAAWAMAATLIAGALLSCVKSSTIRVRCTPGWEAGCQCESGPNNGVPCCKANTPTCREPLCVEVCETFNR